MAKLLPLILLSVFAAIGFVNGNEVGIYELRRGDFSIKLTNYGATILSVILPDKNGSLGSDSEHSLHSNFMILFMFFVVFF